MNWLFVVKKRRPPESQPMIVDMWLANSKLARNRHVGDYSREACNWPPLARQDAKEHDLFLGSVPTALSGTSLARETRHVSKELRMGLRPTYRDENRFEPRTITIELARNGKDRADSG
jgi:hypothetical protein